MKAKLEALQRLHGHGEAAEEGLGDDWAESGWVQPSSSIAKEHREDTMFHRGKGSLVHTDAKDIAELGLGISLYMQFLRQLVYVMLLMSVVSLPIMFLSSAGSRIHEEDLDTLKLATFTLGNIGKLQRQRLLPCRREGQEQRTQPMPQ